MKKHLITLATLLLGTVVASAQDGETTVPKTEIVIGVSNLQRGLTFEELYQYDYGVNYPEYLIANQTTFMSVGLKQQLGKGKLRFLPEFTLKNATYVDPPEAPNGSESRSDMSSYVVGGRLGYEFLNSYKVLEVSYGADVFYHYQGYESGNYNEGYDYQYNPITGQYEQVLVTQESKNTYMLNNFGLSLNAGIGLRLSEKVKAGIETRLTMSKTTYEHKNWPDVNGQGYIENGTFTSLKSYPLGMIYLSFGL